MRNYVLLFLLLLATCGWSQNSWQGKSVDFSHGNLKVSENKRFLVFADGVPFFYLGDTAWELFHRLSKTEAESYLENRRQKGFTVIQAVALAELDGLKVPNNEGEVPLINMDPLQPNEAYFEHVDWVIKKAAEKGLFIGLLPTWGDKIDKQWGVGPVIFNEENAAVYGKWIANRYKDYPNIIWINGGDRTGGNENTKIWESLAKAIKSVDKNHLMTYHPMGGNSSSRWFHNSAWLDFNMCQTGHSERSYAAYKRILIPDYERTPIKPCFDGEPRYEDHPVNWLPDILGWFDAADVRQAAYWSLFSGSFGHTYGCHAIWQFKAPDKNPVGNVRNNWTDDIDLPGASQMLYVRRLMESRDMLSRVPAPELLQNGYVPETDCSVATRGNGYAMVYIPTGWGSTVKMGDLGFEKAKIWWFNPRTGETSFVEECEARGNKYFATPSRGRDQDWILVIDDSSKNMPTPGMAK